MARTDRVPAAPPRSPRTPRARARRATPTLVALTLALAAAAVARAAAPPGAAGARDVAALLDGFEVDPWPDPALWRLAPGASWRPSGCRARSGARSLRAFAGGSGAPEPACDAPVAPGASAAALLVLDLRAATAAHRLELSWELWARLVDAPEAGLAIFLRLPGADGAVERIPVFGATAWASDWLYPVRHLDLRNLVDVRDPRRVFDLRGGRWELEWVAAAPAGAPAGGGLAIDDLRLVWEPDLAVPSPTVRLVRTTTPTPTPRPPTPTATPSREPTPTARPTDTAAPGGRLYLPIARRDPPPPSPTPTPGATGTPVQETPVAPARTPSATPPATDTATPTPVRRHLPWAARGAAPAPYPGPSPAAADVLEFRPAPP